MAETSATAASQLVTRTVTGCNQTDMADSFQTVGLVGLAKAGSMV